MRFIPEGNYKPKCLFLPLGIVLVVSRESIILMMPTSGVADPQLIILQLLLCSTLRRPSHMTHTKRTAHFLLDLMDMLLDNRRDSVQ
jgi:hypothetical protein